MDRSRPISPRIVLAAAAMLALAACGGSAAANPTATPPAATQTPSEPAMQIMAKGGLHDVDGSASGVAELVALPGGMYEVILDTFLIDAIAHTNVILVANTDVTKTANIDKSKVLDLGPLKGKDGMQTYAVPADMASAVMGGYHTVVIWDTEMAHAIAAAPLK